MNILFLLLIFVIEIFPASSNPESQRSAEKIRPPSPSILINRTSGHTKQKHLSDSAILTVKMKEMYRKRSHSFYKKDELEVINPKNDSLKIIEKSIPLKDQSIDNSEDLQFHMEE